MRSTIFALAATTLWGARVTIRNDVPRLDQFGNIVNAHDGSIVLFDGVYFMYGTVYENCTQQGPQCSGCGYSPNTFGLYTSFDLQTFFFQTANILCVQPRRQSRPKPPQTAMRVAHAPP